MIISRAAFRRSRWIGAALWAAVACLPAQDDHADLQKKAAAGETGAMIELAQRAQWNNEHADALKWFRAAAAKGHGFAQFELAKMYREGNGVAADPAEALRLLQRAAEGGLAVAQIELAERYANGDGVQKNLVTALQWYRKAAQEHHDSAAFAVGEMYVEGRGTKPDVVEGVRWLQRAANLGHEAAAARLMELLEKDPTLKAKVEAAAPAETKELMAKAQKSDAKAQHELANFYTNGEGGLFPDEAEAVAWLRKAADQGFADAQYSLGYRHLNGYGVDLDAEQAKAWLEKAAAQKHGEAIFTLGDVYQSGMSGFPDDPVLGNTWFRRGAEIGHADSQRRLAENLLQGVGGPANAVEALRWFKASAELGNIQAMVAIGNLASSDDANVRDLALAKQWLKKAAELGDDTAQGEVEMIENMEQREKLASHVPANVPPAWREMFVSALSGDSYAQWKIAEAYANGADGMPRDPPAFEQWRERAAKAGRLEAQESLGIALVDPASPRANLAEGVKLLQLAVDAAMPAAQAKLGELYATGRGVEKSETKAAALWEKAARSDRDLAWRLRQLYAKGLDGGAPHAAKADEWLSRARTAGHPEAIAETNRIVAAHNAENARIAAAKAAEEKAKRDAEFVAAEQEFDAVFAAATSREEREKAVATFSQAMATVGFKQRLTVPQIAERVLKTLLPKMEANVGEAGAYVMAIYSQAFDQPTLNRVMPANVATAVRTHAQGISAAFNAKQQALAVHVDLADLAPGGAELTLVPLDEEGGDDGLVADGAGHDVHELADFPPVGVEDLHAVQLGERQCAGDIVHAGVHILSRRAASRG